MNIINLILIIILIILNNNINIILSHVKGYYTPQSFNIRNAASATGDGALSTAGKLFL